VRVLVPNLGSTSLKVQLLDMADETVVARGRIEAIGSDRSRLAFNRDGGAATEVHAAVPDHRAAVEWLLSRLDELEDGAADPIDAVGLKTVHGGPDFTGSHLVTDEVLEAMRGFIAVAPAHNRIYVDAIETLRDVLPGTPMVAVFETGFHRTIPEAAHLYGVPYELSQAFGIRRYGFHGSSHRFISQRVPELLGGRPAGFRLVSCHLGGSSSICAVRDGESVDTSFGFSPQSGVEQGTRCGDLDPFVVFHLMERMGATAEEVAQLLCKRSGLLGISGLTGELRELEEAAAAGHVRAALAIDVYVHGIRKQIGALAAVLGGLDALAFTGGIGENSWQVRERVCAGLGFLGVELDPELNRRPGSADAVVSSRGLPVSVLVVRTNEELVVARETVRVLDADRTLLTRASLKEDSA
jgi:acetate kinase